MFCCQICHLEFNSKTGLSVHLVKKEKVTLKSYYDKYYKIDNQEGKCIGCGKETTFDNGMGGYAKYCSASCKNQDPKFKDKVRKSNLERHGVEYPQQSEIIRNKSRLTLLQNYGVDSPLKSETIRNKTKTTNLENTGKEYPSQIKEIRDKIKNTLLENYGVDNPLKSELIKEKVRNTNLDIYGTPCPLQNEDVEKKSKETLMKNYGVTSPLKSNELLDKSNKTKFEDYYTKLMESTDLNVIPNFLIDEYKGTKNNIYSWICKLCNNTFDDDIESGRMPRCPTCFPKSSGTSKAEKEVSDFCKQYYPDLLENDRTLLNGKEIDIYIPEIKLAIEFNGLFWHCESNGKTKKYHLEKTLECKDKDVTLIHIFEDEWMYKSEIIKSMLLYRMKKLNNRIYAREGSIKEITNSETKDFLNNNHIQGKVVAKINIGLFYKDELISILTFGKSRYNKKYDYEMLRFCNKRGYVVNGAFSKLFKYFIAKYHPKNVITYADMRYSVGNLYESNGFKFLHYSDPNYYYFKNGEYERFSRVKFQKHKLEKKLAVFNNKRTEYENMQENGWDRIWDCGNSVFIWGTVD